MTKNLFESLGSLEILSIKKKTGRNSKLERDWSNFIVEDRIQKHGKTIKIISNGVEI